MQGIPIEKFTKNPQMLILSKANNRIKIGNNRNNRINKLVNKK